MASLFKKYTDAAKSVNLDKFSNAARSWFMKNVNKLAVSRTALLKDDNTTKRSRFMGGRMYMFFYDPKLKKQLPYYDRFPLAIMVGPAPGGYYGINLHYLAPRLRAILLDRLMDYTTGQDEKMRFKISYRILKATTKLRPFKPCFKHYLKKHVRSQMVEVNSEDWETAIFLPTEQFKGASKRKVFGDSVEQII